MEILNPPPERLYRYRSARSTYLIDELEQAIDRRIYFSKYSAMNDPFEAAPRYAASSLREVRALVLEARAHGGNYALVTGTVLDVSGPQRRQKKAAFKRSFGSPVALANKLKKTTEKIFRKIRIEHSLICLSAVSDSLLMWAHYGCGHNGVVFEYEFDPSAIKTGDPLNPVRVRYASTRPEVSEVDLMRFSSRSPGVRDEAVSDRVFEAM